MLKADARILIVDDDRSFGKACSEAIQRSGYGTVLAHHPEEALQLATVQQFQAMIVDCMLPKIPGVDLVSRLKALQHSDAPVFLISGIYRDRGFIRQAQQSTGATAFFSKPFKMDELVTGLDKALAGIIETPKDPLPQLFANENCRRRQILEAVELSENVHGFELPFIYALFLNAKISGQMNIIEATGELFGVSFKNGKIVSVEANDTPSKMGVLLMEREFLNKEELELALGSQGDKPLGEHLIAENLVSPHAINQILLHQMEIRLGQTVFDTSVEVNFIEAEDMDDSLGIDIVRYVPILCRWFRQKVSQEWLQHYYIPWLDNQVKVNGKKTNGHPIFYTEFFLNNPDFLDDLVEASTLQQFLETEKYKAKDVYLGVHLLTTTRCLGFGVAVQPTDFRQLASRLKTIAADIDGKNYFEVLNVSKNARAAEIRRSYHELAKMLHPDKLPANTPADILELNSRIFSIINDAHNTLKDEKSKTHYLKQLEEGHTKQLLKAESTLERGKHLLKTGKFKQSLDLFNEAYAIQKDNFELNAYRTWARLKVLDPVADKEEFQQLDYEITELAQHDRRSELFHFIKGLYQFQKGNLELAKNHIENAVAINPNFLEARRELNLISLKQKSNKPVDILRADLKDVVGMLFKRKD